MQTKIVDALNRLKSVSEESEFSSLMEQSCQSLGFDHFHYHLVNTQELARTKLTDLAPNVFYTSTYDRKWIDHYLKEDYMNSDPVMQDTFRAREPIVWDEHYRRDTRTKGEEKVMAAACDYGIRRGMSIPIRGPAGEYGALSVHSSLKDTEFYKLVNARRYELDLLAYHAHDLAFRKFQRNGVPKHVPLSDREIEVLRWTADGKTAWEIATILNISERTVHFHIQKIMTKFGARNKTHAMAKASSYGLLSY